MKIMLVAGARPNFMKIASVMDAIHLLNRCTNPPIDPFLVHTGQHYDEQMSRGFFRDLGLPQPDVDLDVGSASHAHQTAEIMKRFEPVLLHKRPDIVVVVGDVNSTVACSLVASKVTYHSSTRNAQRTRPLIAHVEGGLRSFDRSMPEEINRILTDALSDLLFITHRGAEENLLREGIAKERIFFVGNTMVDTLLKHRMKAEESPILTRLGLKAPLDWQQRRTVQAAGRPSLGCRDYAVVTLHRPGNVDNRETIEEILEALAIIAERLPVFFPVHPRTMSRIREFRLESYCQILRPDSSPETPRAGIYCLDPLGYLDFLCLMSHARLVLTDSGGIQEETTVLGIPCVTVRQNTERPVTLSQGTNVIAGTKKADIIRHALRKLSDPLEPRKPELWDGRAGERIVKVLTRAIDDHA